MNYRTWALIFITIVSVVLASKVEVTTSYFVDQVGNTANTFQAWTPHEWVQTTQADFNAGILNNVDTASSPGDVKLALNSSSSGTTNSPSSSTGGWINAANAYSDGSGYAYVTSGTPSTNESYGTYGFSLTGKTITKVGVRYDAFTAGATITQEYQYYDSGGDDNGGGSYSSYKLCQTFSSNIAFTITSVNLLLFRAGNPGTITVGIYATTGSPAYPTGSALTSGTTSGNTLPTGSPYEWRQISFSSSYNLGAGTTYAIVISCQGSNKNNAVYWRCDTSSPTYGNGMYGRSSSSGAWGASYMDNTRDHLFQTYGDGTEYNDQIRVDVSWDGGTSWSSKQTTTLTSSETTYWYDVTSATTWDATKLNDSNFKVRVDAYTQGTAEQVRLDWLPVEVTYEEGQQYASLGTIGSQVLDTGISATRWDALFWDETLQSNTTITLEVRASDTAFAKDAANPSWISVGGTSPITSGLPSGRYKQWRATLTTSDTFETPILLEVRLDYH